MGTIDARFWTGHTFSLVDPPLDLPFRTAEASAVPWVIVCHLLITLTVVASCTKLASTFDRCVF